MYCTLLYIVLDGDQSSSQINPPNLLVHASNTDI